MNPQGFWIQNLLIFQTNFLKILKTCFLVYSHNELHNIYYKDKGDASSQV
jgi:hypothetical protein